MTAASALPAGRPEAVRRACERSALDEVSCADDPRPADLPTVFAMSAICAWWAMRT
jgi:hypothetical protein